MNYVKETLQRQNGLWLALFGGSEEIEVSAPQQEQILTQKRMAEQGTVLPIRDGDADIAVGTAKSTQERIGTQSEQELLQRGRETLLRELAFRRKEDKEAGADRAGSNTRSAEAVDMELARWEAEAAQREGRRDLETADARAISRRFERDARRYDGGFVFY
jgi:hypothetical protein